MKLWCTAMFAVPPCRTTHDAPASWIWDSLAPGASLPFAWDDITAKHVVEVAAEVLAPGGRTADELLRSRRNLYAFEIDTLQVRVALAAGSLLGPAIAVNSHWGHACVFVCCSGAMTATLVAAGLEWNREADMLVAVMSNMQKPHVIELRGATRSTGNSKVPPAAAAAGSGPTAGGAASAVNVTSSGSGTNLPGMAAAGPTSPRSHLPRSHTVAGDGRLLSRMAAGQAGSSTWQGAAAANRQRYSMRSNGTSSFFIPPPLDVDGQQQHGSSGGGQGSSSPRGQHASHVFGSGTTPPPTPAVAAAADAGHAPRTGYGQAEHGASQPGVEAAGGRASHTGLTTRHSTGGGGAVTVFDRKVYVSVYADGPTKVLCFSDDPLWTGSSEADEGGDTLQLLSRLHHMARQLMTVDRQLEMYQGAAYGLKPGRGSRAVPALLLLQHQQQLAAAGGAAQGRGRGSVVSAGGGGGETAMLQQQQRQQELPVLLQGPAGNAAGAGSTTTAALALLQQMGRSTAPLQPSPSAAAAVGRGTVAAVGFRSSESLSADAAPWASAATAAALGLGNHSYPDADNFNAAFAAPSIPAARISMISPQTAPTISHVSGRPLVGAAAAAAGVRVTGGLLGAEGGLEGGVKLYYDKLTLLLDSQLPLGGNVKVSGGQELLRQH